MIDTKTTNKPISTKANRWTRLVESGSQRIPPLEDLVHECFKYSIDQLADVEKQEQVKNFMKFTSDLHCRENLSFLIEIFRYEYYHAKIFGDEDGFMTPKQSYLNNSLPGTVELLPFPKHKQVARRSLRKRSTSSLRSDEHEPAKVFASTIDDLGYDDLHVQQLTSATWSQLMELNVEESDSHQGTDSDVPSLTNETIIEDQWHTIMLTYVYHNAPEQINLSGAAYQKIIDEDNNRGVLHDPIVFLTAKNEILQLLEENVYHAFVHFCKGKDSRTTSPLSQGRRVESPCEVSSELSLDSRMLSTANPAGTMDSPMLTPVTSLVSSPKMLPKKSKPKFLHMPLSSSVTSTETPSASTSSSSLSFSNFLGHFRVHSNSYQSNVPSLDGNTSDVSSTLSPNLISTKEKDDKFSKIGRLWKSKKK